MTSEEQIQELLRQLDLSRQSTVVAEATTKSLQAALESAMKFGEEQKKVWDLVRSLTDCIAQLTERIEALESESAARNEVAKLVKDYIPKISETFAKLDARIDALEGRDDNEGWKQGRPDDDWS